MYDKPFIPTNFSWWNEKNHQERFDPQGEVRETWEPDNLKALLVAGRHMLDQVIYSRADISPPTVAFSHLTSLHERR